MNNEITEVCSYLKTKAITIPSNNEWLILCIECFKSQGINNIKKLNELVFQQWLLADLNDIAAACFPKDCLIAEKIILTGNYSVQFNYVINIGISFHKQLLKIRRPDIQNNLEVDCEASKPQNNESFGNRTLKMEITDGVSTVLGFEDQLIPFLQEPIVPGKKAILLGPIECRRGVLFLRPYNIRLLGGEVDTLHIQNATENILARALNLPENPDPYKQHIVKEEFRFKEEVKDNDLDDEDETLMMAAAAIETEAPLGVLASGQFHNANANYSNNLTNSSLVCRNINWSKNGSKSNTYLNSTRSINDKTDYDFDDDFDIMAAQTESVVSNKYSSQDSLNNLVSQKIKKDEFDPVANQKYVEDMNRLKKELEQSYGSLRRGTKNDFELVRPIKEQGKILVDYLNDTESLLGECDDEESQKLVNEIEKPQIPICSVLFPPKVYPTVVEVPARIVKVLKKPKLKGDKWCVSALVAARGIELEVSFSSEAVDKVFTVSAAEILARREQLQHDQKMKERMNETLKESQQRFSKLNCNMMFSFNDSISKPTIIDIVNY